MGCIEFIGCTSAGKSTLVNAILQSGRQDGLDIWTGEDFTLKQIHAEGLKNNLVRALLVNFLAILVGLAVWRKYNEFYKFVIHAIDEIPRPDSWLEKFYIGKNVFKNIGIFEIARQRLSSDQVVLLDEGPLQLAQVIYVHSSVEQSAQDIPTFLRLVPTPDIIIYLQRDEKVLIERTMARGHKRIPSGSRQMAEVFIQSSVDIFKKLTQSSLIKPGLLIVDQDQNINIPSIDKSSPSKQTGLQLLRAGLDSMKISTFPV